MFLSTKGWSCQNISDLYAALIDIQILFHLLLRSRLGSETTDSRRMMLRMSENNVRVAIEMFGRSPPQLVHWLILVTMQMRVSAALLLLCFNYALACIYLAFAHQVGIFRSLEGYSSAATRKYDQTFIETCRVANCVPSEAFAAHLYEACCAQYKSIVGQISESMSNAEFREVTLITRQITQRQFQPGTLPGSAWQAACLLEVKFGPLHWRTIHALTICASSLVRAAVWHFENQWRNESSVAFTSETDWFQKPKQLARMARVSMFIWSENPPRELIQVNEINIMLINHSNNLFDL